MVEPDTQLKKNIFVEANRMREEKGCKSFSYDDRLEKAAQVHATRLAEGKDRGHERLKERLGEAGFPVSLDCKISRRSMPVNYTEGITSQSDEVTPESLKILTSSGPGEAHYDDFYDPKITKIGIGVGLKGLGRMGNHMVIDYGIVCGGEIDPDDSIPIDLFDVVG